MFDNDKKIALVTGANKGIGYEISKKLANKGITVIIGSRNPIKGQEAQKKLKQEGMNVYSCVLDVTDSKSISEAIDWIKQNVGSSFAYR